MGTEVADPDLADGPWEPGEGVAVGRVAWDHVEVSTLQVLPAGSPMRDLVEAYRRCRARRGVTATTIEDVAREAGVSRATFYRTCPGGRSGLLEAANNHELALFLERIAADLDDCTELDDFLVSVLSSSARLLLDDDELQDAIVRDPGGMLASLHFRGADAALTLARRIGGPSLHRWLDPHRAEQVAEWLARLLILHVFTVHPPDDLADITYVRSTVEHHILPALNRGEAA